MPSRLRRSSSATAFSPSRPLNRPPLLRRGTAAGFSLLEVIVALAILGIGLGVLFQGIGQGLRLRGAAAESVQLALVAERIIGGLPERAAAPAEPEEGEESGCRWRLEPFELPAAPRAAVGPVASPDGRGAPLVGVRITVTAPSGRSWEMSTLLPRAAASTP